MQLHDPSSSTQPRSSARSLPAWGAGFFAVLALGTATLVGAEEYERSSAGTRWLESPSGLAIKVLVEASNLGSSEVEIAEITFPADSRGGRHLHESIEIFYVLSGVMGHVVNGTSHRIEPGGVAIVKPGDHVSHEVLSEEPVKALVIWAPGGEADRIAEFFEQDVR